MILFYPPHPCMCLHVCTCAHEHIHVCTHMCGSLRTWYHLRTWVSSSEMLASSFDTSSHICLCLTAFARPDGQWVSGIPVSAFPSPWLKCVCFSVLCICVDNGIELRSKCLKGKCFTNWGIHSDSFIFLFSIAKYYEKENSILYYHWEFLKVMLVLFFKCRVCEYLESIHVCWENEWLKCS